MILQNKIAANYIWGGRFVIDLISSFPIDVIFLFIDTKVSEFKFLKLVKLVRLFRFGKLIKYLTTKNSIKLSLKMGEILFMLVLWTHWWNWFWFSIIQIDNTWVPPKNAGFENKGYGNLSTLEYYCLVYYYAIVTLIGADILPTSSTELLAALFLVFIGSVLIGILIGQFTNVLLDLISKETQRNDDYDMIDSTMFWLKLPLEIQNRVKDYYDMIVESNYHYSK